jgi:transposase
MFSLTSAHQYYLYRSPTDMRKSFDSLCGIITNEMGDDPKSGNVYIFINKPRNKVKLLHRERGGLVLYYKRLEQGTIELPKATGNQTRMPIEWSTLVMMVEGIGIENIKKRKRYLSTGT